MLICHLFSYSINGCVIQKAHLLHWEFHPSWKWTEGMSHPPAAEQVSPQRDQLA